MGGGGGADGAGGGSDGTGGGALGAGIDGADVNEVVDWFDIDGAKEGFLDPGGAGGFFPIGGGGPFSEAVEFGRDIGIRFFRRFATDGIAGAVFAGICGVGREGATPGGSGGAAFVGGLATDGLEVSGSDEYEDSRFAVT